MYKFSNLIGPVFSQGNLEFSSDGFEIYTPVRNRISKFGLKNTLSHKTLAIEATKDFTCMSLSPNGLVLIAANDIGEVYVISTKTYGVLHFMHVPGSVKTVRYSPDGKLFAVATKDSVLVYAAPCATLQFNPCELRQSYAVRDAVDLEWSDDAVLLAATSSEGTIDIHPLQKYWNFKAFVVTGNSVGTLRSFFLKNSYDFYTVERNGALRLRKCSVTKDMLVLIDNDKKNDPGPNFTTRGKYKRTLVHYYNELFPKKEKRPPMTSAVYNKSRQILVTCFESVVFLHELPGFVLLTNLQISCPISAVTINDSAEWIAFGSRAYGQLVVYEWQSQHFIMDQKSHYDAVECFTFSSDGELIASGGADGKIKVWNSTNAKMMLTFSDHTAPVTGIVFSPRNNAFFSCSEDGTARAFDITRARTFRVFVPPDVAQLSCLSVDPKGELIVAGSKDNFAMYLWSIKTGQFLMTLTGHTGPVTSVAFSPAAGSATVVSTSMDKTARLWDTVELSGESESILLPSEGTCVAWKPNGESFCVSTTNGELSFFNRNGSPLGETEGGRHFMIPAPPKARKKKAERLQSTHYFKNVCYSPCGKLLGAASTGKTVCFYNVDHQRIVATQYVTNNRSFEGVETFTNPKNIGDFGALQAGEYSDQLSMPGTRKGDMAARKYYNQIRINGISFSPTGGRWIAATNEGLLAFSSEVADTFDPIGADVKVTPDNIKLALKYKEYDVALAMSLRLNMEEHLRETTSSVPFDNITLTVASLPQKYILLLIRFLNEEILKTKRVGFYLQWIEVVLKRISSSFPALLTSDPEIEPTLVKLRQRMESVQNHIASSVGKNSEMIQAILQRSAVNMMSSAVDVMKSESMEDE